MAHRRPGTMDPTAGMCDVDPRESVGRRCYRSAAWVVMAACLLSAGCVPGVGHLPDSSGFVYADRDGSRLLRFDFTAGKASVVVEDTRGRSSWPAVSPDGKTVAVGRRLLRAGKPGSAVCGRVKLQVAKGRYSVLRYSLSFLSNSS
jgi:hypothetical protein